eukprot:1653062-Prymnesium_polylepis.3
MSKRRREDVRNCAARRIHGGALRMHMSVRLRCGNAQDRAVAKQDRAARHVDQPTGRHETAGVAHRTRDAAADSTSTQ